MKFYEDVLGGTMKTWLNFDGDLDLLRLSKLANNTPYLLQHDQIVLQVMIQNLWS